MQSNVVDFFANCFLVSNRMESSSAGDSSDSHEYFNETINSQQTNADNVKNAFKEKIQ